MFVADPQHQLLVFHDSPASLLRRIGSWIRSSSSSWSARIGFRGAFVNSPVDGISFRLDEQRAGAVANYNCSNQLGMSFPRRWYLPKRKVLHFSLPKKHTTGTGGGDAFKRWHLDLSFVEPQGEEKEEEEEKELSPVLQ